MKPQLLASAIPGLVGLSLLVSACGSSPGSHVAELGSTTTATQSTPSSTTTAPSAQLNAALTLSRCMRSHGVPNFPDPNAQGQYPPFHSDSDASKQASFSAQNTCKSLLPRGGGVGTPQDRQKKFAFALKVARCLRLHGYPSFPDPTASGQRLPPDIDAGSQQFETAEMNCEQQARKALGLP